MTESSTLLGPHFGKQLAPYNGDQRLRTHMLIAVLTATSTRHARAFA